MGTIAPPVARRFQHRHDHSLVEVRGRRLEVRAVDGDPARPTLVFLHEGLGSIAMWRDFPARVADGDRLPGARLFALRLRRLRPAGSAVRGRLHAPRGARDAARRCSPSSASSADPDRPLRRRVDRADLRRVARRRCPRTGRAGPARLRRGHLRAEHRGSEDRLRDDRPAAEARAPPRRRAADLLRLERHLAAPRLPALEHRGVPAGDPLPGARDPGRRRRVRHAWRRSRRSRRASPGRASS